MKSAQRLTGLFRTLPPVQTNEDEDAAWDTDAESNADHIVLAGMVRKAFREDPWFQGLPGSRAVRRTCLQAKGRKAEAFIGSVLAQDVVDAWESTIMCALPSRRLWPALPDS